MKLIKGLIASRGLKHELAARRTKLYRIAYSWCHQPALADDLVQETMLKAIKKYDQLRDVNTLDTWLYRILFNCWHDYLRHQGRFVEMVDVSDELQLEHESSYQQDQIVFRVRRSVQKLPLTLREVVTLADFAGMSYQQIAEIVDIPIGTVMSRLFRARKQLKKQLLDLSDDIDARLLLKRVK